MMGAVDGGEPVASAAPKCATSRRKLVCWSRIAPRLSLDQFHHQEGDAVLLAGRRGSAAERPVALRS